MNSLLLEDMLAALFLFNLSVTLTAVRVLELLVGRLALSVLSERLSD